MSRTYRNGFNEGILHDYQIITYIFILFIYLGIFFSFIQTNIQYSYL